MGVVLDTLDTAMHMLIRDLPASRRKLSFVLYEAALAVAVHGADQVSAELQKRALNWDAAKQRRYRNAVEVSRTRHAVRHSRAPKSRIPEGNAFEVIGKEMNASPSTIERRAYKKPKR